MKNIICILFLTVLLSGCDDPNSNGLLRQNGNPDAYQTDSQNCSGSFVSDYNNVKISMSSSINTKDTTVIERNQQILNMFSAQYQGVACVAGLANRNSMPTTVIVDEDLKIWNAILESQRVMIRSDEVVRNAKCAIGQCP